MSGTVPIYASQWFTLEEGRAICYRDDDRTYVREHRGLVGFLGSQPDKWRVVLHPNHNGKWVISPSYPLFGRFELLGATDRGPMAIPLDVFTFGDEEPPHGRYDLAIDKQYLP